MKVWDIVTTPTIRTLENDQKARFVSKTGKKIPVRDYVYGEEISDELVRVADKWLLAGVDKEADPDDDYMQKVDHDLQDMADFDPQDVTL